MKKTEINKVNNIVGRKNLLKRYTMMIVALFIYASAYNLFMLPNNIVAGGVSGIAIITKGFIDPALVIMVLSVLLLIISFFLLGKEKTLNSIVGSILFPICVKLTSNIGNVFVIGNEDLLLIAIFAGVFGGIALGLVFRNGFTTGGTDILNQIVSKYFKMSIGSAMLINEGLIVLAGGFVFGWNKAMYAIILIYILSIIADKVILGISGSKAFYIVTSHDDDIKEYILNDLSHGVTVLESKGGFTGKKQNVLMCVVPTYHYFKLKEGIREIDKEAFFVITDSYEVMGGE